MNCRNFFDFVWVEEEDKLEFFLTVLETTQKQSYSRCVVVQNNETA